MDYLRVDSVDSEAAGLLQRCRLLTHSAGTTNKTWSMDDYLISHADIKFSSQVVGTGCSTRVEEAELFGILCAVKLPHTPCKEIESNPEGKETGPLSLNLNTTPTKLKPEDRGWSLSNHQTSELNMRAKIPLRKIRSLSVEPTENSLYHTTRLSGVANLDGFSKILKECRMLSTLHHPNVVQFYGVSWLEEQNEEMGKTAIIVEELMLLTLREVATSFRESK